MQVSMLTATNNKTTFLAFEGKNIELFETRNFYFIFYSLVKQICSHEIVFTILFTGLARLKPWFKPSVFFLNRKIIFLLVFPVIGKLKFSF